MSRRIPRRMPCLLRRSSLSRYHLCLPFLLWIPGVQHLRQAKLSTFAKTVPPLPSTFPLLQSNSDVRTPHPRLRRICLMDPPLPLFLAPPCCMRESRLPVDVLTYEPWTSLGVTPRDSFSPGFSIPTPEPWFPPPLPLPLTAFPQLFLMFLPLTHIRLLPRQTWFLCPHHHLVLPPRPLTSLPLVLCWLTIPLPPRLGATSLPGLIFWFVSLSMKLTSPPGPPLSMCLTPSLLFPRPRLVPFPAPYCVPRPRHFPRTGIPSSPCILLPVRRHLPPRLVSRLGPSGPNPPLSVLIFHALPLVTPSLLTPPAPSLSSCPLPCDLPIPSVLVPAPSPPHSCPPPPPPSVLFPHTIMLNPLPSSPTLVTITTNIPHLNLVDPVLPLRLYDPRNELPRLRVISLMARSLAAGLVHNWSLHYAPYLGATFNFSACLDRDFIDRSRYCGVTTVWQSIFGALVACISRARVPAILPNYLCLSRIILCTAIPCPHSRRSSLSLRPLQDLISHARLEAFFQVGWLFFFASPFWGLRFPSKLAYLVPW